MHEKTAIFKGLVTHSTGGKEVVRVRPTKLYFVDQQGRKYKRTDGTRTGGMDGTLNIYTMHKEQESAYLVDYPLVGKIRGIQTQSSKKPGPGREYKLRKTKLFYIDENGRKFRIKDGYSVCERFRLQLETIKDLDRFKREQ